MPTRSMFSATMPGNVIFHRAGKREGREEDSAFSGDISPSELLASPWVGLHYRNEYCHEDLVATNT
jgi:hypothetical protein